MTPTAAVATLGCKTNQFESAALEERLRAAGYRTIPFGRGADLVIVNTCTVTAATDAQSRNLVRRARRLNPNCRVVVTGCYAQVDPQSLASLPGVALVIGNEEKGDFLDLLEEGEGLRVGPIRNAAANRLLTISSFTERSRAFVQIQNGCDAFCSYCIIPYARGRSRSATLEEVLAQVRRLTALGFPEIVLTGIHIGGYGADLEPKRSLLGLIERIESEAPVPRLRLGSVEPTEMPRALLERMAASKALCPHLHIPLQSGDDRVLKRMGRDYTTGFFRKLLARARDLLPDAAIGIDLIAGFPGETELEFENSCRLVEDLPATHVHVFPFSRRPGTPAASMPGQLPGDVIRKRAARLRELGEGKLQEFRSRQVGKILELVVEGGKKDGRCRGLSRNYLQVDFPGEQSLEGGVVQVRVEGCNETGLYGRLIEEGA